MRKPILRPLAKLAGAFHTSSTLPTAEPLAQTVDVGVSPVEIQVEFLDFDEPQDIPVPEGQPPVKAMTIAQLVQVQGDKRTLLDTAAFPEKLTPGQKAEIARKFAKVANSTPKSRRQRLAEEQNKKKVVELAAYRRDRKRRNKASAQAKRKSR
jgi:hypothetical protein